MIESMDILTAVHKHEIEIAKHELEITHIKTQVSEQNLEIKDIGKKIETIRESNSRIFLGIVMLCVGVTVDVLMRLAGI